MENIHDETNLPIQFSTGGRIFTREACISAAWVVRRIDTGEFLTGFDSNGPRFWWGNKDVQLLDTTGYDTDNLTNTLIKLQIPYQFVRITRYIEIPGQGE